MKISKTMIGSQKSDLTCLTSKVITSADRRIAASSSDGMGQFCIVAPKGIDYVPQADDDSVVIPTEKGRLCIGVRRAENQYEIAPGELALYSLGGAYIILKNDGSIIINGQKYTNGEES